MKDRRIRKLACEQIIYDRKKTGRQKKIAHHPQRRNEPEYLRPIIIIIIIVSSTYDCNITLVPRIGLLIVILGLCKHGNHPVPKKEPNLLTCWATANFLNVTLLDTIS